MIMKEINIYKSMNSWLDERPEAVIRGVVQKKDGNIVEILDENNYVQLININSIYALVYEG